ncbi:MAG: hypothetical protein RLZZ58_743, partial [Pseudomonadota bacterium]
YVRGADNGRRLAAFAAVFALGSPAILAATRGFSALWPVWCDAWSAPYWMTTAAAAVVLLGGMALIRTRGGAGRRLLVLGAAGVVGAIIFVLRGEACLAGPFAALDPLVRDTWYNNVPEGQPLWRQSRTFALYLAVPGVIGIAATCFAWRRDAVVARRAQWAVMLFLVTGAVLVSVFVGRAIAVAHAYALPGLAFAGMAILNHARAQRLLIKRFGITLLALFMAPTISGLVADIVVAAAKSDNAAPRPSRGGLLGCQKRAAYLPMTHMPTTRVFAQIDLASHLVLYSRHSVIATPHHRNSKAMALVYRGFMTPADRAERIVRATGATHLLFCGNSGETSQMIRGAPKGLAAVLRDGKTPGWLDPVYRDKRSKLVLYRVRPL